MKFAICNETFGDWTHERAFALAAECGYAGIEIAPFTLAAARPDGTCDVDDVTAQARDEVRRLAKSHGLEVVGLHWLLAKTQGFYLTSPDAEVRRRTAEYLGTLARLCRDLGGRVMVLGSPRQRNLLPGVSLAQATRHAQSVIEAILPELEACEVTLALEPLGPAEGDFWTTAAEAVQTIERIGSPHVRLHLDVKAMSSEARPIPEIIRENAPHLAHFHANDPNLQGPGFGEVDFAPILAALAEIDYQGWVSVEVFDYSPGPERLARESIEYLQKCVSAIGCD